MKNEINELKQLAETFSKNSELLGVPTSIVYACSRLIWREYWKLKKHEV